MHSTGIKLYFQVTCYSVCTRLVCGTSVVLKTKIRVYQDHGETKNDGKSRPTTKKCKTVSNPRSECCETESRQRPGKKNFFVRGSDKLFC